MNYKKLLLLDIKEKYPLCYKHFFMYYFRWDENTYKACCKDISYFLDKNNNEICYCQIEDFFDIHKIFIEPYKNEARKEAIYEALKILEKRLNI